jgi:hypothetical protein
MKRQIGFLPKVLWLSPTLKINYTITSHKLTINTRIYFDPQDKQKLITISPQIIGAGNNQVVFS